MRNVKMASHPFKGGIVAGSIPALIAKNNQWIVNEKGVSI